MFDKIPRKPVQRVSDDSVSEKSKESDKSAIDFRDKEANRATNPFPSGFVAEDEKAPVMKDAKSLFQDKVAALDKTSSQSNIFMNAVRPPIEKAASDVKEKEKSLFGADAPAVKSSLFGGDSQKPVSKSPFGVAHDNPFVTENSK